MTTLAQATPTTYRTTRVSRVLVLAVVILAVLVGISLLALRLGTPQLTVDDLVNIVFHNGGTKLARVVVLQLRMPRLALALTAGAMLALAGTLLQDGLRNPLAGPELLGVSAGASLVMAVVTIMHVPMAVVSFKVL